MKKLIIIIFVVLSVLAVSGCGKKETPEKIVITLNNAIKSFNVEEIKKCLAHDSDNLQAQLESSAEMTDAMLEQMKKWASDLEYSIEGFTETGDEAIVNVKYKYIDSTPVLTETIREYFSQGFAMALNGNTDEDMEALFTNIFVEEAAAIQTEKIETMVSYSLIKGADGSWIIEELPDAAVNVITNNMLSYFSEMAEAFGKIA